MSDLYDLDGFGSVAALEAALNRAPRGVFHHAGHDVNWTGLPAVCAGMVHVLYAFYVDSSRVPGFECEHPGATLPAAHRRERLLPVRVLSWDAPVTCIQCAVESVRWRRKWRRPR